MVYLLIAFINIYCLRSYYAQIRLINRIVYIFYYISLFLSIWGLCVLNLGSCTRSALIASRAKSPPQYGKLYAFALVPDAFGWWVGVCFSAWNIPGDSPPNFRAFVNKVWIWLKIEVGFYRKIKLKFWICKVYPPRYQNFCIIFWHRGVLENSIEFMRYRGVPKMLTSNLIQNSKKLFSKILNIFL